MAMRSETGINLAVFKVFMVFKKTGTIPVIVHLYFCPQMTSSILFMAHNFLSPIKRGTEIHNALQKQHYTTAWTRHGTKFAGFFSYLVFPLKFSCPIYKYIPKYNTVSNYIASHLTHFFLPFLCSPFKGGVGKPKVAHIATPIEGEETLAWGE